MSVDAAFKEAGQSVGLEIWRIEKLKVVAQEPKTYGEFYSGDSYIILNTKKKKNSPKLEWDLHFWLGKNTSQDEKGIAAYKTVELDDSLGGGPVQYREVQEHESKLFISYFKHGIKYLEGGVESGFKKVERGKYETRLMQCKGKRNIRVKQVELNVNSLNQGDVFILDCGLVIFVWNGPKSSKMERIKAAEAARRIKDEERGGKAAVRIIDEKWETDPAFFKALGSNGPIPAAEEAGDDQEFERVAQETTRLYRVSDATGELEVSEVGGKPLKREHLDSEDCFILDSGPSGIFVWVGRKCTRNEKQSAWKHATDFLSLRGYADWTPVTQLVEDGETPLFKQYFKSWPDRDAQAGMGHVHKKERIAAYSKEKFDSTVLHQRRKREEENLPDDGQGHVQIWRVEHNDLVPQPEDTYGIFYTGDCYIVLYTYRKSGRECYILYFWQGSKSTTDERGASAIYAQRMDDNDLHGAAVQVRVVQGREPEHFLRIFQGRMIIFLGGINNTEPDSAIRLFQIRGTNDFNTRAMQVLPRAAFLNSNDVFLIESDHSVIIWYGKGASPDECLLAKNLTGYLFPDRNTSDVIEVNEGAEEASFWALLGGQEPYASGRQLEGQLSDMPPRLFQCSNASGRFKVEEVVDFSQEDLVEDDVMILDTIDEVYVWVGNGANAIEKKESLQTAMEYIKSDPSGRNPDNTVILQIKQGLEPPAFTGHFMGWDPEKWSQGKTYEDLKRELGQENVGITTVQQELASYDQKHPYSELTKKLPPKGVDPAYKERYLSDEDFQTVFKMSYAQFSSLKQWKQLDLKKKMGLF
ncbi:advillin [Aplysia californica]|uniref:Advillin n=1 Tax=Aplysia californica TaxID=6500 RepID=A0ABM0ZWW7_APLCA|nr:advillin [Aplysia californica]